MNLYNKYFSLEEMMEADHPFNMKASDALSNNLFKTWFRLEDLRPCPSGLPSCRHFLPLRPHEVDDLRHCRGALNHGPVSTSAGIFRAFFRGQAQYYQTDDA